MSMIAYLLERVILHSIKREENGPAGHVARHCSEADRSQLLIVLSLAGQDCNGVWLSRQSQVNYS